MIKDEVDENKSGKKRVKKSDEESDGTQKIESERE